MANRWSRKRLLLNPSVYSPFTIRNSRIYGHDDVIARLAERARAIEEHAPLEVVRSRRGWRGDRESERVVVSRSHVCTRGWIHAIEAPARIATRVVSHQTIATCFGPCRAARVLHCYGDAVLVTGLHRRWNALTYEGRIR